MRNKLIILSSVMTAATVLGVTACTSFSHKNETPLRSMASEDASFWSKITSRGENFNFENIETPKAFNDAEVKKIASAQLELSEGRMIFDNDEAFQVKLDLIQNAKKSIKMVYFIYSDDDSSSVINQALIAKAKSGVEVNLLVDFITNFKNFDLFQMLKREGGSKMKISFYNVPNKQLIYDINYMTLPCAKVENPQATECHDAKMKTLKAMKNPYEPTLASQFLLTGLYARNGAALKLALGLGAQINPEDYKSSTGSMSKSDQKQMIELVKTITEALVFDKLSAKIKLHFAMMSYGNIVNEIINEMTGRLPLIEMEANKDHTAYWEYITDYTHHKLLLVDGQSFVMGGRNVEDSYHMKSHIKEELPSGEVEKDKYIFNDTDFAGVLKSNSLSQKEMNAAYDRMFSFSEMVQPIEEIQKYAIYDFVANTAKSKTELGASEKAYGFCQRKQMLNLECVYNALDSMPGYLSLDARLDDVKKQMNHAANERYPTYKPKQFVPAISLDSNELSNSKVFYLENTSYNKNNMKSRHFGAKMYNEAAFDKNIQAAWVRDLENICAVSREKGQQEVVFHSAYLLFHSGVITRFAKMMSGDYGDCSKVRISLITNSALTTDLAPVNILAQYQLAALLNYNQELEKYEQNFNQNNAGRTYKRFFPHIDYYEYNEAKFDNQSLHSKVTVIGDDIIIGSANADLRSYAMDTNNAIMIRGAHKFITQYLAKLKALAQSGIIVNKDQDAVTSLEGFAERNRMFLRGVAQKYNKSEMLTEKRENMIVEGVSKVGLHIFNITNELIYHREHFKTMQNDPEQMPNVYEQSKKLNERANQFDKWYMFF